MNKLNELLEIMIEHREQDRLIRGEWLSNEKVNGKFKGCFYGCAMQANFKAIEKACEKYGLPLWIGYWSEKAFERLPEEVAFDFPVKFLKAVIDSKQDLEEVKHKLAIRRLSRLSDKSEGEVKGVIDGVINCHERYLAGDVGIDWPAAWSAAWSAARSAYSAESAAMSAAYSAYSAWSAAWSAARSAYSAESAAMSAESAAMSAESAAAWDQEVNDMLEILAE